MLEYPECRVTAQQLAQRVQGRTILSAEAAKTPHRFASFTGNPDTYNDLLSCHRIDYVSAFGTYVQFDMGHITLVLGDGVDIRWYAPGEETPDEHQLFLTFDDGGIVVCRVEKFGGMWAQVGVVLNQYIRTAVQEPGILDKRFTLEHFSYILGHVPPTTSLKEALTTEQRIPGLGNGVLQDVLFNAQLHPRRAVGTLNEKQIDSLFFSLKTTVTNMEKEGGRDTEHDIYGNPGGYKTRMSRYTLGQPCPHCGRPVEKASYLGHTVYFCPGCQAF